MHDGIITKLKFNYGMSFEQKIKKKSPNILFIAYIKFKLLVGNFG